MEDDQRQLDDWLKGLSGEKSTVRDTRETMQGRKLRRVIIDSTDTSVDELRLRHLRTKVVRAIDQQRPRSSWRWVGLAAAMSPLLLGGLAYLIVSSDQAPESSIGETQSAIGVVTITQNTDAALVRALSRQRLLQLKKRYISENHQSLEFELTAKQYRELPENLRQAYQLRVGKNTVTVFVSEIMPGNGNSDTSESKLD